MQSRLDFNLSDVKGVYKNCRGIWAAQWTDEKGQRHTKYFNPKFYASEATAKLEAYKFKVQIQREVELKGGVQKRRGDANKSPVAAVTRRRTRRSGLSSDLIPADDGTGPGGMQADIRRISRRGLNLNPHNFQYHPQDQLAEYMQSQMMYGRYCPWLPRTIPGQMPYHDQKNFLAAAASYPTMAMVQAMNPSGLRPDATFRDSRGSNIGMGSLWQRDGDGSILDLSANGSCAGRLPTEMSPDEHDHQPWNTYYPFGGMCSYTVNNENSIGQMMDPSSDVPVESALELLSEEKSGLSPASSPLTPSMYAIQRTFKLFNGGNTSRNSSMGTTAGSADPSSGSLTGDETLSGENRISSMILQSQGDEANLNGRCETTEQAVNPISDNLFSADDRRSMSYLESFNRGGYEYLSSFWPYEPRWTQTVPMDMHLDYPDIFSSERYHRHDINGSATVASFTPMGMGKAVIVTPSSTTPNQSDESMGETKTAMKMENDLTPTTVNETPPLLMTQPKPITIAQNSLDNETAVH